MAEKKTIIFATGNNHKAKEVRQILGEGTPIKTLKDISFNKDIKETGSTLEENALIKARTIYQLTGQDVFADDSGLEVWSLDMLPGVNTARYAGNQKNADDNMNKLLDALKNEKDRSARFRAVMALIINGEEFLFEGIVNGLISKQKEGIDGFGYDPIFIPEGHQQTFAELPVDVKNQISHRYNALSKMKLFLDSKKGKG